MKVKAKVHLLHNGKKYEAGKEYDLPAEFVKKFPQVFEEIKKAPAEKEQTADLEKKLKEAEKALKAKDKEIETLQKKVKELEAEIQKLKKSK